ncbi:MAG: DsbE family thiol:disulfide interchange protein [Paracoccaceae bacterium]
MKVRPLLLLPPLLFLALAGLFLWGMGRENPGDLPSALIGRPHPAPPPDGLSGFPPLSAADLASGEVSIVNFWASWCPPCRAEHPKLMELAAGGLKVYGVNFRDNERDARAFLAEGGNPFAAIGFDPKGRSALDWGVTAPPETFILSGDGTILFRFAGPLVGDDYSQRFLPELTKALGK